MSLFKKKSTKDKVADQVEPLAERAAEVGNQIGSLVKDSVRAAVNWAEPLAADAYEKAAPLVKDAAEKARPYVKEAYDKANDVAHDAAEKARPYVADATARYEETSALVREDYLPRAKRAAQAALDEARSNSGDLTSRANAVVAASKKELAKPEKKKRGLRKWIGFLAVAGAGAAAAYVAWARSRPVQDPWAEAYWEDISVPSDEPADSATAAGAAADATTAKEKVEEQAAEHEVITEDVSEAELKEEELKEKVEKTREEEAAEAAGILKED
ncbi:MAG: hypothetical protein MR522_07775 [Trueperella sp.]|uniref:hypothetical protein n=1 Tax=Trueperella sp. TaxID=2699835 RepID=UPI0025CD9D76|nr:hypothetical protein [Trueperella sp.]MCI7306141.1 hypothetical protein [Trueperella sp.]MDY5403280.1 hypothetical protein [Trueperella sp.]